MSPAATATRPAFSNSKDGVLVAHKVDGLIKNAGDQTWENAHRYDWRKAFAKAELQLGFAAAKRPRKLSAKAEAVRREKWGPLPEVPPDEWIFGKHRYPDDRRCLITPDLAQRMLDTSIHNRNDDPVETATHARVMLQNRFYYCSSGMEIDQDGHLTQGHTRLMGCILSGVSIDVHVFVGMPAENFWILDQCRPRNLAQQFSASGEVNCNVLSGAVRTIANFEQWDEHIHDHWRKLRLTNSEGHEILDRVGDIVRPAIKLYFRMRSRPHSLRVSVGTLAAGHYLIERCSNAEVAREFAEVLVTGKYDKGGYHPALILRDQFAERADEKIKGYNNARALRQLALYLNAWNHWCKMHGDKPVAPKRRFQYERFLPFPLPAAWPK